MKPAPPVTNVRMGPSVVGGRWQLTGRILPMQAKIDALGRLVVPKPLRDALGLTAGSTVDISRYGAGLQVIPTSRTARLVEEDGELVVSGGTPKVRQPQFAPSMLSLPADRRSIGPTTANHPPAGSSRGTCRPANAKSTAR